MAARARRAPASEPIPVAPPPAPPAFGAYKMLELKDRQCRYPCSTHGSEHRFCGRPAVHHHPDRPAVWCAEHRTVVFEARRPGGQVLRRAGRD